MKILLLLAIFCAVSSASFLPKYTSFHPKYTTTKSDYRFVVTEVTAESTPVRGQYNSLKVCAVDNLYSGDYFTGTWYEIGANYGSPANKTIYASGFQDYIPSSGQHSSSIVCESYGFRVPPFAEDSFYFLLSFAATENYMSEIVVDFTL